MSLLKWSNFFSVGVDDIDEQHKKIVQMLNDMYDGISDCQGNEATNRVLPELLEYTRQHFSFEEEYMKELSFPGYSEHIQKHSELTDQVQQLCDDLKNNIDVNQLELAVFLVDWLKEHIMDEDMQYARYAVTREAKMI